MPAACWVPAYIGLGSNLDDPVTQLGRAFAELAELPARVTNPELGEIRLQFWLDALDGKDGANLPAIAEIRAAIDMKIWPLAAFMLGAMTIALMRYRRTLD